jgi:hypothetical protein
MFLWIASVFMYASDIFYIFLYQSRAAPQKKLPRPSSDGQGSLAGWGKAGYLADNPAT